MTRAYLLFQLHGPLAAWGEITVGEMRTSFERPSRSALLGLIAAALGIRRDDESSQRRLAEDYGLALQVNAYGSLLRDYHTVQRPPQRAKLSYQTRRAELTTLRSKDLVTTVSSRDYFVDAHYVVALWARDTTPAWSLTTIAAALKAPRFTLFLGRKSCPLDLPMDPQWVEADSVLAAFSARQARERALLEKLYLTQAWPATEHPGYYCDESFGDEAEQILTRRDQPTSRTRWQFAERREYQLLKGG